MQSLFGNLEVGRKSLLAQQLALQVASNNIANVNTPGYTRQRTVLQESLPLQTQAGSIGTGVDAKSVQSARDQFLELRLTRTIQNSSRDETVSGYLNQVDSAFESSQSGVQEALSSFFNSFSMLSGDASSATMRYSVISAAESLAARFRGSAQQLTTIRENADAAVTGVVGEINGLTSRIAKLNQQIEEAEIGGNVANGLRDERGVAINELASLVNIHYYEDEDGTVSVSVAGRGLVTAGHAESMWLQPAAPYGFGQVMIGQADVTAAINEGKLGGLLHIRDQVIPAYQTDLDTLAQSVINQVNTLHQGGTDLQVPPTSPTLDFFSPASVPGAAAAFSVNPAVAADTRNIAAGQSGAAGDNANALAIADLANQRVLSGGTRTFAEAFAALQSRIGVDGRAAKVQLETTNAIRTQLQNSRDSVSGVSLDEEAIDLIRFQRAYQASARFISVIDQLTEDVILTIGA
jgi:flagellar hook-associated protein 1 FlgK